ncbi:MAG: SPOR domain-containing protein [Desulfosudis oleivorans]|nr:SPOR domain-containing protein [Desulfosudis oleivorans]
MVLFRTNAAALAVAVALVLSAGCRAVVGTVPPSKPGAPSVPTAAPVPVSGAPAGAPLARMGYTVQVGAFAVETNARRLAESLIASGLDAFYFPAGGGLFKVRFGDYPSREAARDQAGKLKAEGSHRRIFHRRPRRICRGPARGGGSRHRGAASIGSGSSRQARGHGGELHRGRLLVGRNDERFRLRLQRAGARRLPAQRTGHAPVRRGAVRSRNGGRRGPADDGRSRLLRGHAGRPAHPRRDLRRERRLHPRPRERQEGPPRIPRQWLFSGPLLRGPGLPLAVLRRCPRRLPAPGLTGASPPGIIGPHGCPDRPSRLGEQPPGRRRRHPARPADRRHRRVWLGQVLARLRRHLPGGPAALPRDLLVLRPPVHGQAPAARGRRTSPASPPPWPWASGPRRRARDPRSGP